MNTETYKEKLLAEKNTLETELAAVGQKNPDNPKDWEPTAGDVGEISADPNDRADQVEEYEERAAIERPLEDRLNSVNEALSRINDGTFGYCTVGGEQHLIEEGRLDANPAATTCIEHKDVA